MEWLLFALGIVLLASGIAGQIFGTRSIGVTKPGDRRAAKWAVSVVSIVIGLWIVIWALVQLMHLHFTAH